ncbi:hypothetical protein [Halomonas sp. BC04]|uniref:hypothetical protein n=1 Tax=Halomonas sp. BC04 TaxID=1403540 RepID=UPI0003ED6480|nr:hypothetical protein [Halomonas sp. BC04]EWG99903.1 hypothetical protein Q427_22370 [Halomonas sp. BC04]
MIARNPNPATFENPNHLRYAQPLNLADPSRRFGRDWHRLELLDSNKRRFATLYGEHAGELRERAARWPAAIGIDLIERFTPNAGRH